MTNSNITANYEEARSRYVNSPEYLDSKEWQLVVEQDLLGCIDTNVDALMKKLGIATPEMIWAVLQAEFPWPLHYIQASFTRLHYTPITAYTTN